MVARRSGQRAAEARRRRPSEILGVGAGELRLTVNALARATALARKRRSAAVRVLACIFAACKCGQLRKWTAHAHHGPRMR